jgi:D-glycero-D-manno-heptose 1,7-bisphosphate phosphatase
MKLVLLDRDGVLNEDRADYVKSPGELAMLPGAAKAVARLNAAGCAIAICTNQAVVGKGIIDEAMLARIHDKLRDELARDGAKLDAIVHSPDAHPGPRRKPEPGMLREALRRFDADPAATPFVGDNLRDLQAATKAGCPRHLVRTGHGAKIQAAGIPAEVLPVRVHEDLAAAVDAILGTGA